MGLARFGQGHVHRSPEETRPVSPGSDALARDDCGASRDPATGNSPYVFTSTRGTRYNKNTKVNDFKDFREKIGVVGVTFSHLRDGGYTAASNALGVDAKFASFLPGTRRG